MNKWTQIALVLSNPILTGFAFLMWSKAGSSSPILGPTLNILSGTLALLLILFWDFQIPKMSGSLLLYGMIYCVANAIVNITLVYSLKFYSVTVISKCELAYPIFVALFSWMLFGVVGLNLRQAIGAGVALIGLGVMVI